jgi:GT2 family glycosyltransferase
LVNCSEKFNAGICGGSTVDENGNISGSFFRLPNLMVGIFDFTNFRKLCKTDKWHKYFYYQDTKHNDISFPVDVVTGGFMLIKMSTLKKVGLFDETYFMYLEDVDYCVRAKNNGIKIYHTNTSKIMHIGGASSNNKDRIRHSSWLKSRKKYFQKHFGLLTNILIQPIFLMDDVLIIAKKTLN